MELQKLIRYSENKVLVRCELAVVGYREIAFHPLTGSNAYLAIFAPPSDESCTRPDAMIACTQ
jgi:hypothetical protein